MKITSSKTLARASAVLIGLGTVGATLAWMASYPRLGSTLVRNSTYNLGTVLAGRAYRHSWVIANDQAAPLTLRTRFTSGRCGFSLWLGDERVLAPHEELTVFLTCPAPVHGSIPFSAVVEVRTSDAETPELRFRVYGITGPIVVR